MQNVWGVEDEFGPALRVPTSDEAVSSMKTAMAAYLAAKEAAKAAGPSEAIRSVLVAS
jgi:hypothetical protein